MASREALFSDQQVLELAETLPTPFHLLSEQGIRDTAQRLNTVFKWVMPPEGMDGYVNHFAVKAMPNPYVLDILAEEGMGADASSGPEIQLAQAAGMEGQRIMFTSNNTPLEEYSEAHRAGAIINLDDISQIDRLQAALDGDFPDTISFRYAPDKGQKSGGTNSIIGEPEEAKFGVPAWQLEEAYKRARELGVEHFGIHAMVVSNELDATQHVATARLLFMKVAELSSQLGIRFEFVNLGGGLGIPYRPEDEPVDYHTLKRGIKQAYYEHILANGLPPMRVLTENGRHVTGPNGITVFRAQSVKDTFHRIVGLDGSTNADGPRPKAYDAYHEITVPGKELGARAVQRVVGSLCEDNDYFTGAVTKDRELPVIEPGDVVVIHDTGAHWYAMSDNYNGKLRSAEYLMHPDGSVSQIRRAQTRADLFATVDEHPGLAATMLDRQG